MKTIALDSKREITFSAFKDRDKDIFEIKIRVMDGDNLEKKGCIIEMPLEMLNLLERVLPGACYPRYELFDFLKKK